ncbi:hypothetical protein EV644_1082 [Kribbella orskensis]|uniref:HTH iclR-type domain-containing protein n=1 Tax=Kribbella orskensis TaxID=2512216 RepID=A0ABY2BHX2_9ACTN|nr:MULTISPECIES: hypothetical protein [Kribbella]TCN38608.1 hypothetical protein EV642_1082 [Kribbella sp. VKM Ac-2500]TCO20789.1 hypothetical protein EV644_1082 [Kribbella orskensis]
MDEAPTCDQLRARALLVLADRLPSGWRIEPGTILTSPEGLSVELRLSIHQTVEVQDVPRLRNQLNETGRPGLVVADHLSAPVRRRLTETGLAFADCTGNLLLNVLRPDLFISDRGTDRDPWRKPGTAGTLQGADTAAVVRALLDYNGLWTTRDLVSITKIPTPQVHRIVDLLEAEGLVARHSPGAIAVPDWAPLLRRWTDDLGFVRNNRLTRWNAPRGLEPLMTRIHTAGIPHAVTGPLAAAHWADGTAPRSAMIYTPDANAAAAGWNLTPAGPRANVLLAEPATDIVFIRARTRPTNSRTVAPAQIAADLLTGPLSTQRQAKHFLRWLHLNNKSWRL